MNKTAKFIFSGEQIQTACDDVYKKTGSRYRVQGFRDGKAPRKIIEQTHGDVFFEPAINNLFNAAYHQYLTDNPDIRPVADPEINAEPNGADLTITVDIPIQPPFTLGKYKGLEIKLPKFEAGEREINNFLAKVQGDRAREIPAVKGYKIKDGDIAVIDFVGSIAGKEFEGGKGANHRLEIGSNSFIDTFEKQLTGHTAGDKIDVKVTFPKNYHATDLAGKPALFKTEIKEVFVRELPPIDDKLAKESSEFSTLADFKKDIKVRLEKQAEIERERLSEEMLLKAVTDGTKITVNPKIAQRQFDEMIGGLEDKLRQSGVSLEMYANYHGKTIDEFITEQRGYAELGAKTGLVLEAIGAKEGIKDFDKIIEFLKKENKIC